MIRATTGGVLRSYRSSLMSSFIRLNSARNTVLTQRNFNSYAENPAAAAQSFQLHRAFQRVDSQVTLSNSVTRKFSTAYTAIDKVVGMVDNEQDSSSWRSVLRAANEPTGAGRTSLGLELKQLAESIVQSMNSQYADTFIFSGADGANVPFTWEGEGDDRHICYRGVPVDLVEIPKPEYDTTAPGYDPDNPGTPLNQADIDAAKAAREEQLKKLDYLNGENRYIDIGLGLKENQSGQLIEASAYNDSLPGITVLGYGSDDEGDPKNIASMIYRMGVLLSRCDESSGAWQGEDGEEFQRLAEKFPDTAAEVKKSHVELSTKVLFLNNNHEQLITTADNITEQLSDIDRCDLAEAITAFSWAQYCYNAALKMGNSILSGSLMDYLN